MQASIFGYAYYPYLICSLEDSEELQGNWRGIAEMFTAENELYGVFVFMARDGLYDLESKELFDRLLAYEYLTISNKISRFFLDKIRQTIKDPTSTGFSYKLVDWQD